MSRALKVLVSTALLSVAVAGFGAGGAQAHQISCSFSGLPGTFDPDGAGTGVQSLSTDIADGGATTFLSDFDTGNYTLFGPVTCVGGDSTGRLDVFAATFSSSGDYENRVCGTGFMDSVSGGLSAPPPHGNVAMSYSITLADWHGHMTISNAVVGGHALSGEGAVELRPVTGNCVTTDVEEFTLSGAFGLTGP